MHHAAPVAALLAIAGLVAAEEAGATPPREWIGGAPMAEWSRLTGDWAGQRTRLADQGVTIDATLVNELSDVVRAGADDGAAAHPRRIGQRSQVNLGVTIDLEALAGVPRALVCARYQYAGGDDGADRAGDAQGWSNINVGGDIHQLSELWYQQSFGAPMDGSSGDMVRIKLGKVDANSEFDTMPALGMFLNSSAGFSPTIFPLPTYPDPATSINLFVQPMAALTLGLGYYDASASTRGVHTGELGAETFFRHDAGHDKVWLAQLAGAWDGGLAQVGGWRVTGDLTGFDGEQQDASTGWYATGQQTVWSAGEEQSVTAVGQVAGADDNLSDYGLHLAAGLWTQGLVPGRAADGAGLYVTSVRFSDATDAAGERLFPASHETTVEAVYALQATGWWLLRADAQYIRHPGAAQDPQSAIVLAVRSDITF